MAPDKRDKRQAVIMYTYENNGYLPIRCIKDWVWPDNTRQAMNKELKKMEDGDLINRPTKEHYERYTIPENFVWLSWRGAMLVAAEHGLKIEEPDNPGEMWQRKLVKTLRASGIYWRRHPPWNNLRHDFLSLAWRFRFIHNVSQLPFLQLEQDIAEYVFRVAPDTVRYPFPPTAPQPEIQEKEVMPDGFFTLLDRNRQERGVPPRLRITYEIDNHTHPIVETMGPKFVRYAAWIKSTAYQKRFGDNSGVVLVITHGGKRLKNMMAETIKHQVDWAFLFTTFTDLDLIDQDNAPIFSASNINSLTAPVWRRSAAPEPIALLSPAPS